MDDREMGRRIGYWRRRRNLTQAVFADRICMSKSWVEKVARLRSWGVVVLFGPEVYPLHEPGTGSHHLHLFPWPQAVEAINALAAGTL